MSKNKKEPSSLSPNRDTIEKLCKKLGIPFSKNQRQSGTASIRFMNKPKSKKEERRKKKKSKLKV